MTRSVFLYLLAMRWLHWRCQLIDKRFYRRKYNAAKVLAAFGATARDETDLERLTAEMLRVVDQTMQPEFVGLWLKEAQSAERKAKQHGTVILLVPRFSPSRAKNEAQRIANDSHMI